MEKGLLLVTGAGGFLGRHVAPFLREKGWAVRAMVRPNSPLPPWCRGEETVQADLLDRESLERACAGVKGVVHMAALLNIPLETRDEKERLRRVNLEGTALLLEACRKAGVEEFVLLSSVAAQGDPPPGEVGTEDSPERPDREYGRTKLEAERLLAKARSEWGLRTLVLRPVVVYGEGDKGNVARMMRALKKRRFFLVSGGKARKSLVYAGNVAAALAHLLPLEGRPWEGKKFLVMDPRPYSLAELSRAMARALGVPPPRLSLPALPLLLAGGVLEGLARPFGRRPLFSAHTVRKLASDLLYSGERLFLETGFEPPYALEEALERTARWIEEEEEKKEEEIPKAPGPGSSP